MRTSRILLLLGLSTALLGLALLLHSPRRAVVFAQEGAEWQLTFTPINHALDNNDNFSRDDRFLVVDTRETLGAGIGNCTSILKVSVSTGLENVLYAPAYKLDPTNMAPGVGAASFSHIDDEVIFIHGPLLEETPILGFYSTRNRRGGVVRGDGAGDVRFVDFRDVTSDVTTPGAHRGGTHRHEYTLEGNRIGFTYDDFLLPDYGRTVGYMEPHPRAPKGVSHWVALLVPVVPAAVSKPGDLERAADDSWVGRRGLMRAFIGNIKEADGKTVTSSLFVVDIPESVDITTSNSGTKTTYMQPPQGIRIRRLTRTPASGIVRGSWDGKRIAYYATAPDGSRQVFLIASEGSDQDPDPAKRPIQASFLEKGATGGVRWHPSGNSIAVLSDNGVAAICVKPGPLFGAAYWLTPHGAALPAPEALVWSHDGSLLAFNRRVPTYDAKGNLVKDFNGNNFRQIFLTRFPDRNGNGIVDAVENGVVRNGASFIAGAVAPDAWASVTGFNLAARLEAAPSIPLPETLGGVRVEITDSGGATKACAIGGVHPEQVNFVVPAGLRSGPATATVTTHEGRKLSLPTEVAPVAPGLFSANASGAGVAAAVAVRVRGQSQSVENVFSCSAAGCAAIPLDLGPATDEVVLLLFGTGLRGAQSPITATIGGQKADVLGAAAQSQWPALDQVNLRIPRALAGKGEVAIVLTVDGKRSNAVTVNVK
jgi:uncharacterized protein (TIGR03437 family)